METLRFRELIKEPQQFFKMLPQDWQDEIVPFWTDYKDASQIYIIEDENHIMGGGIVFQKSPPHFEYFENDANKWFDEGYLYLGFIWISAQYRNKNLGSFRLHHFYLKNGFTCKQSFITKDHVEWLFYI